MSSFNTGFLMGMISGALVLGIVIVVAASRQLDRWEAARQRDIDFAKWQREIDGP